MDEEQALFCVLSEMENHFSNHGAGSTTIMSGSFMFQNNQTINHKYGNANLSRPNMTTELLDFSSEFHGEMAGKLD